MSKRWAYHQHVFLLWCSETPKVQAYALGPNCVPLACAMVSQPINPSNFQLECRFVPGFYAHDQRKYSICPLFCWFLLAIIGCIAKPTGQEINHTYLGKVLGHSAVEVHRREGRPAPSSHAAIDGAHLFFLIEREKKNKQCCRREM